MHCNMHMLNDTCPPNNLPKFWPFVISSIPWLHKIIVSSIVDSFLCMQLTLYNSIIIMHSTQTRNFHLLCVCILKRATKTFFNAKYQGHYVCAYPTLVYCVLSHAIIIVNSRAVSAVSALLVLELQHIRVTLQWEHPSVLDLLLHFRVVYPSISQYLLLNKFGFFPLCSLQTWCHHGRASHVYSL